jgi:adenine-specific DNA-methyltransferase
MGKSRQSKTPPHPIVRRYWAEQLVRLRRADEDQRSAASQRRARIDPNPHQIDAVMFALRRVREGGCILADEVGLGKTIEAGLVIAQLLAEGARRILVILPKPLLGQWRTELFDLFGISAHEGDRSLQGDGVFLVGREFAGGERGAIQLRQAEPFDLCVIDEAHEIFAGIYKRYDRTGFYDPDSTEAVLAHRVRDSLGRTPVLLLTATPIQNTLTELWGLVQYVEPTGTLLGSLATFREVFCEPGANDRVLAPGQAEELRRRVNVVLQRTLRRQAQDFLERKFVKRRARLFEYHMSPAEKSLYDDVEDYLLEPDLCAFQGRQRRLLLIGFHRRMASSLRALAASLSNVADRLRKMLRGEAIEGGVAIEEFAGDLEDDELPALEDDVAAAATLGPERIRAELARVESFIERANRLPSDTKARRLVDAVRDVLERGRRGDGSGRVVIFTESLTTQRYLEELLLSADLGLEPEGLTLFRGVNDSARARQALERWQREIGDKMPAAQRPSPDVAVRLALVHEFRHHSRVFISTEAGAKGLNLQFCDTIVNYDLPWNPQRIEQRIGRCHRYSQERDVTVINFLAADNEAERLTFQILSEKLELFGTVLSASDAVLYEPGSEASQTLVTALGAVCETQMGRIHHRARSRDDITSGLRELSQSLDAERQRFEAAQQRMAYLIESRFDDSVRQVFRRIADQLPNTLAELDDAIERVVTGYLAALGVRFELRHDQQRRLLWFAASDSLPHEWREGGMMAIGHSKDVEDVEPLHPGHGLVRAAVDEARTATARPFSVRLCPTRDDEAALAPCRGRRGRLIVTKIRYGGFEPVDRLLVTALLDGEVDPLAAGLPDALLRAEPEDVPPFDPPLAIDAQDIEDAVDEAVFCDQAAVARAEQDRFDRAMQQLERYADDQALVLRRRLHELQRRLEEAQGRHAAAAGADARARAEEQIRQLEEQLALLDARRRQLETRQDAEYQRWRDQVHQRRFAPPTHQQILDVEFIVA